MSRCPNCGSRLIGWEGYNDMMYYCPRCDYEIDEDGKEKNRHPEWVD